MLLWQRYQQHLFVDQDGPTGLRLDISRMRFGDDFLSQLEPRLARAYDQMAALEAGAIANPDEQRRVGHYWLRAPELAPEPALRQAITETVASIKQFAAEVHEGRVRGKSGSFTNLLVIGIGGSALGPQLVSAALESPLDRMRLHFFDNTDPDGFDRVLARLGDAVDRTLVVVVSKSGGTKETRNGMLEAERFFTARGVPFAAQAVAVTGAGSELDRFAESRGWLRRFPMWDWVGGRTSELSAVGLLPAALQGIDIDEMLRGARDVDALTRQRKTAQNPAALLAAMWLYATGGRGEKDMVVLPYKDRLELFSRYLQQLVMESLGKERDLHGQVVHQGIAVYGNKGSTDQHAYVQQLRDGVPNFFVTFLEVLRDRQGASAALDPEAEGGATAGDYLHGFLRGTRQALYENGRDSITITIPAVTPYHLAGLIALYERAVGIYAFLVEINAYHQPGVEAGKRAATAILSLQARVLDHLRGNSEPQSADEIAAAIGAVDRAEEIFALLEHLAHNPERGIVRSAPRSGSGAFTAARFGFFKK